jgi:polyisoprenoid-binding protein YceI/DNA-binding MarR family transcriptional regulator
MTPTVKPDPRTPASPSGWTGGRAFGAVADGATTDLEADVWEELQRATARLHRSLSGSLVAASGVTLSDHEVLRTLLERGGRLGPSEMSEALGWERSRLSHQLARLERRGFVHRRRSSEPGRRVIVELSPRGERAAGDGELARECVLRERIVGVLGPDQLPALLDLLRPLSTASAPGGQAGSNVRASPAAHHDRVADAPSSGHPGRRGDLAQEGATMSTTYLPQTVEFEALTGDYELDPAHTRLGFIGRHAMITKVRGHFATFSGRIRVDGTNPERSSAEVRIDAASLSSRNAARDAHLRSNDFLDVETYPELGFVSTRIEPLSATTYRVTGELTIRDVTRPVTLDFTYGGAVVDDEGQFRIGFEGSTTIERKDWGLTWNFALEGGGILVGEKVVLEIEASAVRVG